MFLFFHSKTKTVYFTQAPKVEFFEEKLTLINRKNTMFLYLINIAYLTLLIDFLHIAVILYISSRYTLKKNTTPTSVILNSNFCNTKNSSNSNFCNTNSNLHIYMLVFKKFSINFVGVKTILR